MTLSLFQECGVTGRRYTYGQVLDKSVKLSKSLIKRLKLHQGDVVALIVPNTPDYPIAILGILKAGLTLTCINPFYTPSEHFTQLVTTIIIHYNTSYMSNVKS